MKRFTALVSVVIIIMLFSFGSVAQAPKFKLGNEVLLEKYEHLLQGKRVGLITNQSGVNSQGNSLIEIFAKNDNINMVALYSPEHGIDGIAKAGEYVESQIHPSLGIPVYSLYGKTRMPNESMLKNIDILVFDMQDVGSRTYTYMSTLNYCMVAAQKYGKPIMVLDRPNPVGGVNVDGPVMEDPYISFVGVDKLSMAHGMTAGELALFFNRNIGADLSVITMEGWTRDMLWQDTGLKWVQTSPNIPDIDSLFGYMATGIGEGTGVYQADKFKWIGGKGINSDEYATVLNSSGLLGVTFIPENRGDAGGVRLNITDYNTFNPAKTGFYALGYAFSIGNFKVPKSTATNVVMFDKIMGTNKIGEYLEQGLSPQEIEQRYTSDLNMFKVDRQRYVIYDYQSKRGFLINAKDITVTVRGNPVVFDTPPHIDSNNRLMVPVRAITEAMGAFVDWNPASKVITINRGSEKVIFTIVSNRAIVNDEEKIMDTIPVIHNQRTLVPVRYVGEYFGANVHWDPGQKKVTID